MNHQKERVMVCVDGDTGRRLRELAAGLPVARYIRELTISLCDEPPATLADLIVEIRQLGKTLELSDKRMAILDIFLEKASPATLDMIRDDLTRKVESR